jgi:acyl carrier protein|tara:strand:- start:23 stop:259 length:237 start_codon:yes stop_codon:yes gene_type:complete
MNILKSKLIKIFKSNLKIKGKFNEKSEIYSVKKWDSLANFNILLSIEKELKIRFNTKEFSELNSFKAIFLNVKKKSKS